MYFHVFLQLENFSPSMGKFLKDEGCMEDAAKATTGHPASFLPWNAILRREHLHSRFFIILKGQQRILYQPNPLPQKEQDRIKGGNTAPRLLSEMCVPPVLICTYRSFLSRSAWLSSSLQLLRCYEVQRYMEVLHSLLEDALVIRIKGG